ncbi:delta-like protein 4 [Mizuhopecten yessoensis]|uniref:delta-like protein 4 n=1 Tax=Mizuhopecten yessoensis TaxID=6573 RepID=UPI000B45D287|nr:delta-like protein 4 [Mizuhopecten yessoensis]
MSHTAFICLVSALILAGVCIRLSSATKPTHRIRRQTSLWWRTSSSSSSGYQENTCIQKCYNGGVCYNINKCRCTSQYKGTTCEEPICNAACSIHGNCILPNVCQCSTGYEGKLCDSAICVPQCQNGGNCSMPGECTCDYEYTGGSCEQAICKNECLNGGKCTSPDVCKCTKGYTGFVCESAICTKPCLNGGSCIAPNICACASGYLGAFCELGGDPDSFLSPSYHFTNKQTGNLLSWYEEEPLSIFGKSCLVKVEILNADVETLLTATSYTSTGELFGNYTVGGADHGLRSSGTNRAACLEFRCPSDIREDSVIVNVTIATSRQNCNITKLSPLLNVMAGYDSNENQEVAFQVLPHRDYGSMYGIYITYGLRQRIQYIGEKMCRSGTNYGGDNVVPSDGTALIYTCN